MNTSIPTGAADTSSALIEGGITQTDVLDELAQLLTEARTLAGRLDLTESSPEREAFRARKSAFLERLNFATSPTHIAAGIVVPGTTTRATPSPAVVESAKGCPTPYLVWTEARADGAVALFRRTLGMDCIHDEDGRCKLLPKLFHGEP